MIFTIPWTFRRIGWHVWKDLKRARQTGNTDHIDPVRVFEYEMSSDL
jgi:hypothetical protein